MGSTPGSGSFPEERSATHSCILAGKIPWTEEPGGLQSMGLKESDMTEQLNKKTRTWRNRQLKTESRSAVFDSWWPHGLHSPWNPPGQNTGVGSCSLLRGLFPTQGLNPGLTHCGQILYQLSHMGSPVDCWLNLTFPTGSGHDHRGPRLHVGENT